jgi:peptidoglycan hydrolase-like protein with peptidoglycan-binding domain
VSDQLTSDTERLTPATEPNARNGDGRPHDQDIDERLARKRRRWPAAIAGAVLGCAATIGVMSWNDSATTDTTDVPVADVALTTVEVGVRDLIDEVEWSGTLAAGAGSTISSPAAGTITAIAAPGDTVGRGDVIARIDERPVVVLLGSTPMWRDLVVGDEGDDVLQLETNLSALGFDPDGAVTIDGVFTSATSVMVDAWQASLGVEETGEVDQGDVVVIAGESDVVTAAAVGTSIQSGAELVTLETPSATLDVVGRAADVDDADTGAPIDSIAAEGTPVEHGTVLYTSNGVDTVAVIELTPETTAVLDAIESGDVEALESVLTFIGFDPTDEIVIDDEPDLATAAAVMRWQDSVGLPPTGSVDASGYVVVPNDRDFAVGEVVAAVGEDLADGRLVLTLSSPTLALTADVAITEIDEFEPGDIVTVEQVDETTFTAAVTEVSDTTTTAADGGAPTVLVTFEVVESPDEFVSGTVTITTESSRIDGATVVPTRALVTLREGGFAVEKVGDDGSTTLVGVELGTFDDGVVEIVSGDLAPGDVVVVPS